MYKGFWLGQSGAQWLHAGVMVGPYEPPVDLKAL